MSTPTPIAPAPPAAASPPASSTCPPLAPRTLSPAILPAPPADNPAPPPTCGVTTHKEWVVPPRPKPGRKPATDTPPTKRKAQNRAAQRAFRERRAARVNELEDKLKELTEAHAAREAEHQAQLQRLTQANTALTLENTAQKAQLDALQHELSLLRKIKPDPDLPAAGASWLADAPAPDPVLAPIDFTHSFRKKARGASPAAAPAGCGREGGCACAAKRAASPPPVLPPPKRARPPAFPASFTSVPDPCGFCSDGTPCVCAEVASAMDMEESEGEEAGGRVRLAPLLGGVRELLTPPAEVEAGGAGGTVVAAAAARGCPPGGCEQCRADPMSTLFCQSVNSLARERGGGCCGGGACAAAAAAGDAEAAVLPHQRRAAGKTFIPASAAYQTLSRHKAWESVADLGKLVRPLVIRNEDGRCPEVEVSSVRDVLKMLDLRFGRD